MVTTLRPPQEPCPPLKPESVGLHLIKSQKQYVGCKK